MSTTKKTPAQALNPQPAAPDDGATGKAGSLSKTLDVLDMVMSVSPPPSAARITEALDIPRPTTNRIIANLIRLKFLKRDIKNRQLIEGDRLLKLAQTVVTQAAQRGPRHEILKELSIKTKETCNVGLIVSGHVQYIDRVESQWPLSFRLEPGSTIPLHCTALGKLLLSHLPDTQRDKYLNTMTLRPYTENTIVDLDQLRHELDRIAAQGVSIDNEEYLSGVIGMAVPIPNNGQFPILALAIAAPKARATPEFLQQSLPHLHETAQKLALCYHP